MNITHTKRPAASKYLRRSVSLLPLLLLLLLAGGVYAGNTGWAIRLRSAHIHTKPSGDQDSRKATLYAGQPCEIISQTKDWAQIEFTTPNSDGKKTGWIHATALKPSESNAPPQQKWVKKGADGLPPFNPTEQLKQFITQRHLDLKPVLKMEKEYPSAKDVNAFLDAGKLGLSREDWPSLEGGSE